MCCQLGHNWMVIINVIMPCRSWSVLSPSSQLFHFKLGFPVGWVREHSPKHCRDHCCVPHCINWHEEQKPLVSQHSERRGDETEIDHLYPCIPLTGTKVSSNAVVCNKHSQVVYLGSQPGHEQVEKKLKWCFPLACSWYPWHTAVSCAASSTSTAWCRLVACETCTIKPNKAVLFFKNIPWFLSCARIPYDLSESAQWWVDLHCVWYRPHAQRMMGRQERRVLVRHATSCHLGSISL